MEYPIEDARDASFFKICTFSQYQKTKVKEKWIECLKNSQLEPACHWTTELVCSGLFADLWELILFFFGKFIHLGNPKLALYLDFRFQRFREVAAKTADELDLRNHPVIRKLFAEIAAVLCLSVKRPGVDQVKVRKEELDLSASGSAFKASSSDFIRPFFREGDPLDLFAPLNELCFALASKNTLAACYWIEWVLLYQKNKTPAPRCADRPAAPKPKYAGDVVWLLWDIVISYAPEGLHKKLGDAAFNLFRLHYAPAVNEKRRFLLYFVAALSCDPFDPATPMIADEGAVQTVLEQHHTFYRDIRKHSIRLKPG
jgi:hypothetical protein